MYGSAISTSATGSFAVGFLTLAAGPVLGALVMLAVRERTTSSTSGPLAAATRSQDPAI
jgi:hypothetical protein